MPTDPVPIVVPASGDFLGNDGAWSPFLINVGKPSTQLRVLASTEISETWIVLPEGCASTDPKNCTEERGGAYNVTASKTWVDKSHDHLVTESNLGYISNYDNGDFGLDTLGVGAPGHGNASLDQQVFAAVATNDFFLGNLGLANRQHTFGDGSQKSGFLSQLNMSNLIPSLSYGYTAGASYHQSNASLTLGGFDASRFTPNDVTFSFASDPLRSKVVALQMVVATDSKSETILLDQPILALVDSTVPEVWLPENSCKEFEKAFGLVFDPQSELYLINGTTHDALKKRDARISFQLSNTQNGGPSVNITLPYSSFDLNISAPFPSSNFYVHENSMYFPLRRAANDSQYTLGRTFLQESYLMVNYESNNFSISQSLFPQDSASNITAIQHVETQTTLSSPTNSHTSTGSSTLPPITTVTPHTSHSLGTPAIAGIAVAIVLLLMIAGGIGVWLRIKRNRERKRRAKNTPELAADPPLPPDAAELVGDRNGHFSGSSNDKKGPRSFVEEVSDEKQTQIDQREIDIMNNGIDGDRIEMSGPDVTRSELPSPEPGPNPFAPHELSTPEAELMRSELSTPEPAEMPSPGMVSVEMSSPDIGGTAAGEQSPPLGAGPSPWSSPDLAYTRNRTLSRRPVPGSIDSSESEGGWTRDGIAPAPTRQASHSRAYTAEPSETRHGLLRDRIPSSSSSHQRPQHTRADSTDSESPFPSATIRSVRPVQAHTRFDSSDSESFPTLPQRRPSLPPNRPPHRRLDSKDSSETFETRLELSPPGSPFFPPTTRLARDRPIEALPSLAPQSSQETLMSPTAASTRSALRSPEPWGRRLMEEDEDKAGDPEAKRKE